MEVSPGGPPVRIDVVWIWTIAVALGEMLGFAAPAIAGVASRGTDGPLTLITMVLGGAFEGAILGWSQALVLRRIFPLLSVCRWVALTSVSASIAWLVGMAPSTFHDVWESWPVAGAVAAAATLGVLLLCSIGTAQWLELRRHILGAGVWIPVTAGAWCLGLLAFSLVAPPLWHAGQSTTVILAIGLVAGALMAVTMAATSGFALSWMVKVHLQESHRRSLSRTAVALSPKLGTYGPRQSHQ